MDGTRHARVKIISICLTWQLLEYIVLDPRVSKETRLYKYVNSSPYVHQNSRTRTMCHLNVSRRYCKTKSYQHVKNEFMTSTTC